MKIFSSIVLLFFVLFLVAPTIVVCLKQDKDSTTICEDCNAPSSSIEEIKNDLKFYTFNPFLEISFLDSEKSSDIIIFENLSKHDLICASIFIPPPNKV
ncbi:hypothetical protein [Flavobacterium laiguense]|uniref:Uncharacterized protein n=1 Tax=Flavobacterium laiguense TaxID=2169409 RepID=A0A2U1JTH9_9FLAO|nr:hypothetical protein [Flavobacterium laiguense]PWA08183.1 hypothetical protein DB891_12325 [Flavobacterium laiguense]